MRLLCVESNLTHKSLTLSHCLVLVIVGVFFFFFLVDSILFFHCFFSFTLFSAFDLKYKKDFSFLLDSLFFRV